MKYTVLNYTIILTEEIEKEKVVYNALAPALGVADCGSTIDEALEHIREAIECHVEGLMKLGWPIPQPEYNAVLASHSVSIPENYPIQFA